MGADLFLGSICDEKYPYVEDMVQESDSQSSEISEIATVLAEIYLPKARRIPHFSRRDF